MSEKGEPMDGQVTTARPERHKSPEEIRKDIEQTRAAVGETLDEIQAKLQPSYFTQQAREVMRARATAGKETIQTRAAESKQTIQMKAVESKQAIQTRLAESREMLQSAAAGGQEGLAATAAERSDEAGVMWTSLVTRAQGVTTPVVEHVRRNPLPHAVAAVALGLLLLASAKRRGDG